MLYLELKFNSIRSLDLEKSWSILLQLHKLEAGKISSIDLTEKSDTDARRLLNDIRIKQEQISNENTASLYLIQFKDYTQANIYFSPIIYSAETIGYLLRAWLLLLQHPTIELTPLSINPPESQTEIVLPAFSLQYVHHSAQLPHHLLSKLKRDSEIHHTPLPLVLFSLFQQELQKNGFTYPIKMSLGNRFTLYPYSYDKAFFGTSAADFFVKTDYKSTLLNTCHLIEAELRQKAIQTTVENINHLLKLHPHDFNYALFACSVEQNLPSGSLYSILPDIVYCNFKFPLPMIEYNAWEQNGHLYYRWSYAQAAPLVIAQSNKQSLSKPESNTASNIDNSIIDHSHNNKLKWAIPTGITLVGAGTVAAANNTTMPLAASHSSMPSTVSTTPNTVMDNAFNNYGESLVTLSNSPETWENKSNESVTDNKTQETSSNLSKAPTSSLANAAIASAATAGLAAAAAALKQNDTRPDPAPTPPSKESIAQMDPEQVNQSYDNYQEKVLKMHSAPSKADLLQGDLCAQFMEMSGSFGTNAVLLKDELSALGANIDSLSGSISSGDPKAISANLDSLSNNQLKLSDKLNELQIDSLKPDALTEKTKELYTLAEQVDNHEKLAILDSKIADISSGIDDIQSLKENAPTALMDSVEDAAKAQAEKIKQSPVYQNASENLQSLQSLYEKYKDMDCKKLADEQSRIYIAKLEERAKKFRDELPLPENPADAYIDAMKAKNDALNKKINAFVAAHPMALKKPELALNDPGIQSALDDLHASANDLATNVQGKCPICSASFPNTPKVPSCGHNHADILSTLNIFQIPTLNLNLTVDLLNDLANKAIKMGAEPFSSLLFDRARSVSDILEKIDGALSLTVLAFDNPYEFLARLTAFIISQITEQHEKLLNCPNYKKEFINYATGTSEIPAAQIENAQRYLTESKEKLTKLMEQKPDSATTAAKWQELKSSMKSKSLSAANSMADQGKNTAEQSLMNLMDQQKAAAMAAGTAAFACWQNMNMAELAPGNPDEILINGFQVKCPSSLGPPVKMLTPPGSITIGDKSVLIVNGKPLIQDMGMCIHLDKTKPIPCCKTIMIAGGAQSTYFNFPIATKGSVKLTCGLGCQLQIIDSGQNPKEPVTTK